MEIGTKKWHESLSDMGWEVLALAGMLLQASVLAIIIGVVMLVNERFPASCKNQRSKCWPF